MTELRVGHATAVTRRRLGPVAWFVLEELLLGDGDVHGTLVVSASARSLATALSLNKDTVARALTALADAGLVVPVRQRSERGRFGTGAYRIERVPGIERLDETTAGTRREAPRPRHTRSRSVPEPNQPSLFDASPASRPEDGTEDRAPASKQVDALAPRVRPGAGTRHRNGTGNLGTGPGPC